MSVFLLTSLAMAQADLDDRERFFMPAFEAGVLWSGDPALAAGVTFRTSIDWRMRRIRAPFLRVSYDSTVARYEQRDLQDAVSLTSPLTTNDIVAGGGIRFGPRDLQVVTSLQGGIQLAAVPELRVTPDGVSIDSRTTRYGLAVVGLGLEWYVDDDAAVTLEVSGRSRFGDGRWGLDDLASGITLGFTTAL